MKASMKAKYYYSDGTVSDVQDYSKTLHREDGPAIEHPDGTKYWYVNDKRHREDGPAIERTNGDKVWYLNGKRHREDGPAIDWADGYKEWHLNGKQLRTLTKKQLIRYMEVNNLTLAHLFTDSDEVVRTSAAKYDWKKSADSIYVFRS